MRIGEVAAALGVSVDTLRRWESQGRVRFERHNGQRAGVTVLEEVGSERAHGVLGWRSDDEVVVLTQQGGPEWRLAASVVDVATGDRRALVGFRGNVPNFAAQAWAGAVVPAPAPPLSPDPRLVAFLVGLALVVGASVWRSVRGRRGHP